MLFSLMFVFLALGGIVAPFIFRYFGFRLAFMFAAATNFLEIIGCGLPVWKCEMPREKEPFWRHENVIKIILVIGVCLNGLGGALLWVGLGDYLAKCAIVENKGYFYGLFWSIY